MSIITNFIAEITAPPPFAESPIPDPPDFPPRFPQVSIVDAPSMSAHASPTLDAARAIIIAEIRDYLAQPHPDHILLVRAGAGIGKTHICVNLAEELGLDGRRVLYAGPRHKFFADVMAISKRPDLWYEWLPRQAGNADIGKIETCRHATEIAAWHARGYDGISFCAQVCGWDYINHDCVYHAQERNSFPCIFGQHAHLIAHPLRFDVVIGDEEPTSAFMHEWVIGMRHIMPAGLDPLADLTHILDVMTKLATQARGLSGPKLIEALGGAQYIIDACAAFRATPDSLPLTPKLRQARDVETADYFHLPTLVDLLMREAQLCLAGENYLHRIILNDGKLLLLLRKPLAEKLPEHIVWLDATGNPLIYEACFGRPVQVIDVQPQIVGEIVQVHNRTNSKISLFDEDGEREAAIAQLQAQVDAIAARHPGAALITYQELTDTLARGALPTLHFGAARGTNVFKDVPALIVAGTPMPSLPDIDKIARMIFFERNKAFDTRWTQQQITYAYTAPDGTGRAQMVGGYWHDPDLQAVLWSKREAELIQAVHRARILTRQVPVYLLSSLPLAELPPTRLLSIHELLNAPEGINAFRWSKVLQAAYELANEQGYFTIADLERKLNISRLTATKYWRALAADTATWERIDALRKTSGRPANALRLAGNYT